MSSATVFFSVSTFELRRTTRNGVLSLPSHSCSSFIGSRRPINQRHNMVTLTFKPRQATVCMEWQNCTVRREINVAYNCYLDREAVPQWMPLISSVKILEDKPELSWWSLKYEAFGRDLEFSWLAHYMQPIPNQKIHWRSLEGLPNRGAARFFPKGSSTCLVELTVSYEVPQFLSPVASILQPFNENLMRRGLERVRREIKVPVSVAYNCYLDREAVPQWMPLISSVKILEDKPELSWWSLKYEAFGRDLEFSWLAHYMQPIPNQKIHWRSLEGLPNRGAARFFPKGSSTCLVELTVSYEVPQFLSPVASILQPFNENLMRRGLERFENYARAYQLDSV